MAFTKGCVISTPSDMDAKELSLVLISFAKITGDDRGTACDRHRLGRDQQHGYERIEYSKPTIALPLFHGQLPLYISTDCIR